MAPLAYPRALLKLSGEALAGEAGSGIDFLVVDRLALDLVHHHVQGGLVAGSGRMALERLAVDHQRHVHDVGVGGAPVRLVGEFDDGVRAVIEEAFEAGELAFRVLPNPVRHLEVLAPDDRPHG